MYLEDEEGHDEARALLLDTENATVTGAWSRIEVTGALVRAARRGRVQLEGLLAALEADLDGPVSVVRADPQLVEESSLELVRRIGLRALDAWHLATAQLTLPKLVVAGEPIAFATRDLAQGAAAATLGFTIV